MTITKRNNKLTKKEGLRRLYKKAMNGERNEFYLSTLTKRFDVAGEGNLKRLLKGLKDFENFNYTIIGKLVIFTNKPKRAQWFQTEESYWFN